MSEANEREWKVQFCEGEDWTPFGEPVFLRTQWYGARYRTVARTAVEEMVQSDSLDDLETYRPFQVVVTDDAGKSKRVIVTTYVEVTFRAAEVE